ncbi:MULTISPECIES: PolC-type DNA polymerase III [unclassified Mesotoga]|uniref:PolC-type DNA polymerase III n=1 Tax=unclassified Mesotoga TaxID=1184398 RepID=UPI000A6F399F|nr:MULTISPECIES: PolC-type DNA polymerase III [unclassified Mesotoga]
MKLCMKNLKLPISRLLSRVLKSDPAFDCGGIEISGITIDSTSREVSIDFSCEVNEDVRHYLESTFREEAMRLLGSSVRLSFEPGDFETAGAEKGVSRITEEQFREILKLTNGASSYLASSEMVFEKNRILITVHDQFSFQRISSKKHDLRKAIEKVCERTIPFDIVLDIREDEELPVDEDSSYPEVERESKVSSGEADLVLIGREIRAVSKKMKEVLGNETDVVVSGKTFGLESRNGKLFILTFNITDYTDSLTVKLIGENARSLSEKLREGDELTIRGKMETDTWIKDEVLIPRDINRTTLSRRVDNAPEKRVELHLHTKMSALDSVVDVKELVNTFREWGHDAAAVTDHGVVQSVPEFYFAAKKNGIKPIFGMEGYMINDSEQITMNIDEDTSSLDEALFVVFDLETTGLNPKEDEIIEIGAVKMRGGEVIETYSSFIKPVRELSSLISSLTGITEDMLSDARSIKEVLPEFVKFTEGSILVAHNSSFDYGFVRNSVKKHFGGDWEMPCVDTLALAKSLFKSKSYSLDNVVKRLKLGHFDHHRAYEDAKVTAEVLKKFIQLAEKRGIQSVGELEKLRKNQNLDSLKPVHVSMLAKNKKGLENLYRLVTASHTKYFYMKPRIPKSLLTDFRDGLLIGSACVSGELSKAFIGGASTEELEEIAKFYDYIEVMPLDNIDTSEGETSMSRDTLTKMYREFYRVGKRLNIPVVMTGDVHFINPHDDIYRAAINAAQDYDNFQNQPSLYLHTTEEMMNKAVDIFEDKAIAKEVVIDNSRYISSMIEEVTPIEGKLHPPVIEGAEEEVRRMALENAERLYGNPLPEIVEKRLSRELDAIIGHGYAVLYLIAQKMVAKSNEEGYVVGSRGSVGSSLVANVIGITEVNPLPPHYLCSECGKSIFPETDLESGYDLPRMECPGCGNEMAKNGQSIPFETFLGFEGDKVPDIDLNFSGEYQERAHAFIEELFGRDHVFRAGTISTLAERTAFGFVRAYSEKSGRTLRRAEQERIARGIVGVKRTTGQHPGGLMIVPKDMDVHTFTPVQHPANDTKSSTLTTHFAYEVIHDDLVKIDALGHDDPTFIRMLKDITGVDPESIPMDDTETLAIFSSLKPLGVKYHELGTDMGTLGIPEFGTTFVRSMLADTRPSSFGELVRISGLSHGTDVWLNNAKDIITSKQASLSHVIACRDDIMNYLIARGMDPKEAFKIMEKVRKGKGLNRDDEDKVRSSGAPEWFINSCKKIKYLFPRAHAAAYVSMGYRVAYFKVHYPLAFYSTYFSIKGGEFDIDICTSDVNTIKKEIIRLRGDQERNVKDRAKETLLEVVMEMLLRGFGFLNVDLMKSHPTRFLIEGRSLRIPFNRLQNMGDKAARSIEQEREKRVFSSVEDLIRRTALNKTSVEMLRKHGALKGLAEKEQIRLF